MITKNYCLHGFHFILFFMKNETKYVFLVMFFRIDNKQSGLPAAVWKKIDFLLLRRPTELVALVSICF
jgi:hypothetical protein